MLVTLDTSQRLRSPVNTEPLKNMHCGRAGEGVQPARARRVGGGVVLRCAVARGGVGGRERLGRRRVCAWARGAVESERAQPHIHGGDLGHVPAAQVAVERGAAVEHALRQGGGEGVSRRAHGAMAAAR
eukprot:3866732-Prymnesium_polylepis.1